MTRFTVMSRRSTSSEKPASRMERFLIRSKTNRLHIPTKSNFFYGLLFMLMIRKVTDHHSKLMQTGTEPLRNNEKITKYLTVKVL